MDFLQIIDWSALLKIILIDIVLGGDNAIVIAVACAGIPLAYQRKAILYGTAAAIGMRIVVLLLASYVMQIPFVKLVAGLMLFWVGYKLLVGGGSDHNIEPQDKMWDAIKAIAIADLVMSIDNVFAVTGAAQSAGEHSGIYAVAGVLLSIPVIVFGASLITKLMDRFPIIIWAGGALLGWVATEMIIGEPKLAHLSSSLPHHHIVCALGAAILVVSAYLIKDARDDKSTPATA